MCVAALLGAGERVSVHVLPQLQVELVQERERHTADTRSKTAALVVLVGCQVSWAAAEWPAAVSQAMSQVMLPESYHTHQCCRSQWRLRQMPLPQRQLQ